jgi:ribonuclease P protein component
VDRVPRLAGRPVKRRRLSRSADFERVYRQGRSVANRYVVMHTFPRPHEESGDGPRLGLSVSRKVGGAVERNLVKRTLREAFATEAGDVASDLDVVLVARPPIRELVDRDGVAGVRSALAELVGRAPLAHPEPRS